MSRTRIGVVGAGVIARRHVRTLAAFDDLDVAAVADMQVDRAEALAGTVGATSYGDVRQMLDGERLDAVYVCVPPFAHGEVELEVVERDLRLFVEKPLAADLDTAVPVARRVQDKGLVTGVGYHWRWLDTVERAQELLADRPARLVTGPGWTARRRWRGGSARSSPAASWSSRPRTTSTWPGCWSARSTRCSPTPAAPPRRPIPTASLHVTAASVRFADGAVGSFTSTCLLGWPHQAALHIYGDEVAVEITEKEMVVTYRR
jgi:hypothetical protein